MNKQYQSIAFFFPYYEVSGVPVLFFRMANAIALSGKNIQVYVIDYPEGAIARNIIVSPFIKLIPFELGKDVKVPEDSTLVMQTELPFCIKKELVIPQHTKVVFWTLHPDNLIMNVLPFSSLQWLQHEYFFIYRVLVKFVRGRQLKLLKEFLNLCLERKSIWFMDQTTVCKTSKYLFSEIGTYDFMPVPANSSLTHRKKVLTHNLSKEIHFCWIGRLCDWKSYILLYTIKRVSNLAKELKLNIVYHIVGEGPFKDKIASSSLQHEYFKINMRGEITPIQLELFLIENVDIVTAMGTSALEGAKLGIPTVLLDFSKSPVKKDYNFRWLFDTINFDLGHEITKADIVARNDSLRNIIHELMNNYISLSNRTLDYFNTNHNLDNLIEKFINKLNESSLTYNQIDSHVLENGSVRKLYLKLKYSTKK